ncbi:MAG TPA: DUF1611 domain-containing protein [Candidatus Acidoferrales bacterium]|nr:DUF1611 domain-containing protein [Candidatus Acidoferrales bacterium]
MKHLRRYLILAPGAFADRGAKTAHGVIAYADDPTVAVVDPTLTGKRVCDVLPHVRSEAPIVADVEAGLWYEPTSLLIGLAPPGGRLPAAWRREISSAIRGQLEIVSGLHDMIADDDEFARLAAEHGTRIWDVRTPPPSPLFSGQAYKVDAVGVLTVGSDCAVGKMTTALELTKVARNSGRHAKFVPTGQTGIMIAGWGIAVDRVIADFAPGAAESLVCEAAREADLLFIEGQGAINHPAYAPVTMALLYGTAPDALILCHMVTRKHIEGFATPVLSYREMIRAYESLCAGVKPAKVLAIALNTFGLSDDDARQAIERARTETGLPADDVVRFGAHALYDAIAPSLAKSRPLKT